MPCERTVCGCCLSVYLCENLNSVSCFLLFVSCCFAVTARSYGPHTAFIISVLLSPSLSHRLTFFFPFSLLHAVLCSTLISTDWNWRKQRQIKRVSLRKQGREVGDDGGMLMESAFERAGKANRYQGVTLRRKMIWTLLCCFLSLSRLLPFSLSHPFFFCRKTKGKVGLGAETQHLFDPGDEDKRKESKNVHTEVRVWMKLVCYAFHQNTFTRLFLSNRIMENIFFVFLSCVGKVTKNTK